MPDTTANCAGITSPNPFWLASAPPSNSGDQVMRAFDAGWGGAVWKTLGDPIQNVSSRFGAINHNGTRIIGFNNIELITDRPLETNLREIREVKKRYPKHAVVASLMFGERAEWIDAVKRCEDAGADGLELNFGCPHGMCERGMGSAVGQEPRINEEITSWVKSVASIPVLVKLTPNVGNIVPHGLASQRGGADGVALINTVKSIIGVDIDRMVPLPRVGGRGTNGGYCGAAVRPIALHMVAQLARSDEFKLPISGIGGISEWRHVVEFLLLGASSIQVATAAMLQGYRIVHDMETGLSEWMRSHGFETLEDFIGLAVPNYTEWGDLDINYEVVAEIDEEKCIGCQLCYVACRDGGHDAVRLREDTRVPRVDDKECVGCNLCAHVCPVDGCIAMTEVDNGMPTVSWNQHLTLGEPIVPPKAVHV
ncbi:MAG: NAD-dependent dihydropyrimidine dehydrogenase subunit PreA [Pseudomonadota bacterium]